MLSSRYLPWVLLSGVCGLLIACWMHVAVPTKAGTSIADRAPNHESEKHFVNPRQLADANEMVDRTVSELSATAQYGRHVNWSELSGGRPLVLIFIKEGCPCSGDVEPFFQRVEELYADEARFAGLIDGSKRAAAEYATEHSVGHPVLADPEKVLIRQFKVKNGCYVVLLTPGGVISGCWPGCSIDTMRQLGRRIASLAGVAERPLDVSGMPGSLTTGCPFKL
jgi:peroxiredoxin